ncbi:hypothetical protein K3495_g1475 [Podosphaera aphanis]|nr:hypothetical protein K3495_g1475 [Podosphaera aphanis]
MSSTSRGSTPESRSTSGFISVFRSLTGIKPLRNQNSRSQSSGRKHATGGFSLLNASRKGSPDYKSLFEQLRAENPLSTRISAADSLSLVVQQYPMNGVTSIFNRAKDLIHPSNPTKARVSGFELLTACAQSTASTDPERLAYFRTLTAPAKPEDFHLQLAALVELSKHGRDLSGFHYEALPLLNSWLRQTWANISTQGKIDRRSAQLNQEANLAFLLVFIVDVIKFSFNVSSEETVVNLIDIVLEISVSTSSIDDIRSCINVIDSIVTYGDIPIEKLEGCLKVLCSLQFLANEMQQECWRSISNICVSHNGENTVRIVLQILDRFPPGSKQELCEIRGALLVLEKLFAKNGQNGYPLVPFTLLIKSLSEISTVENLIVKNDILHLIISLMNCNGQQVLKNVMDEDWSSMFGIIAKSASQVLQDSESSSTIHRTTVRSSLDIGEATKLTLVDLKQNLQKLIARIQDLLIQHSGVDFFQRLDCVKFLVSVHRYLPEECARLVIDLYMEYRYCFPSDVNWKDNTLMILNSFFCNQKHSLQIRLHALKAIIDVYQEIEAVYDYAEREITCIFVNFILQGVRSEKNILVLHRVMGFAVTVANATLDNKLFNSIIDVIRENILNNQIQSQVESNPISERNSLKSIGDGSSTKINPLVQTPANVSTKALIQIFITCMYQSAEKVIRIYEELLWIAKNQDCQMDARISALKLLCRLRADWANRIYLTSITESDGLVALLYRTPGPALKNHAYDDFARQQRSQRVDVLSSYRISRSSSLRQRHKHVRQITRTSSCDLEPLKHEIWAQLDLDLPEFIPEKASSILVSGLETKLRDYKEFGQMKSPNFTCPPDPGDEKYPIDSKDVIMEKFPDTLNITLYLETIIGLLQYGCDWEIYRYIIVHLSSQLTNQALFKAAIPQIRILREFICDQIKNNSVREPPISSGLRKSDVTICLFQTLNVVMSYHRHFSKNEEDEIVRTFLHGIGERTSKCCLHALSICCHELPGSTSKALVNILTKMSQIITQSHVAIHVLEFLACLARLPNLYVNFREQEYRIIFAICFRYFQYVRDQKAKENMSRNSINNKSCGATENYHALPESGYSESNFHPNSSDDLPQYVYALAYHVIVFWFLSLKLPDRAGQVSWITKNLVSTDSDGNETIDEQAQVTLDFMQRVAYADVEESGPDPSFTKEVFGGIKKKRWVVGNSLITIEQTTRGDWAQITKRQPSGTSCYIIQEKFSRPPQHQALNSTDTMKDARYSDENVKLPSHLLLQLSASVPIPGETMRPIPLPDCKAVERAIDNFNRTFTVDGHKVGVIYIGENQTNEVEILSNIHGSSDYTKFLSGLGTLTKLRGANFNTQGLDRQSDADGEYTFCWRDRVTEIVFHVTTQMPTNLDHDPQCSNKKKHIGNDFVNIIFNNSGLPFNFNTFPSDFNFVNIVVTPGLKATFVARRVQCNMDDMFYKVQVMSKPGFPEISPAAESKIVSLATLPEFVRLLALNASVFSLVWANRAGGEHVSSWLNRLREIKKIREKYGVNQQNTPGSGSSHRGSVDSRYTRESRNISRQPSTGNLMAQAIETTNTEAGPIVADESLVESLDFSKWA